MSTVLEDTHTISICSLKIRRKKKLFKFKTSLISGLQLNTRKSKALQFDKCICLDQKIENVVDTMKVLGITFSTHSDLRENWLLKIESIEKTL